MVILFLVSFLHCVSYCDRLSHSSLKCLEDYWGRGVVNFNLLEMRGFIASRHDFPAPAQQQQNNHRQIDPARARAAQQLKLSLPSTRLRSGVQPSTGAGSGIQGRFDAKHKSALSSDDAEESDQDRHEDDLDSHGNENTLSQQLQDGNHSEWLENTDYDSDSNIDNEDDTIRGGFHPEDIDPSLTSAAAIAHAIRKGVAHDYSTGAATRQQEAAHQNEVQAQQGVGKNYSYIQQQEHTQRWQPAQPQSFHQPVPPPLNKTPQPMLSGRDVPAHLDHIIDKHDAGQKAPSPKVDQSMPERPVSANMLHDAAGLAGRGTADLREERTASRLAMKRRAIDTDYTPEQLRGMKFEVLVSESFDHDISTPTTSADALHGLSLIHI